MLKTRSGQGQGSRFTLVKMSSMKLTSTIPIGSIGRASSNLKHVASQRTSLISETYAHLMSSSSQIHHWWTERERGEGVSQQLRIEYHVMKLALERVKNKDLTRQLSSRDLDDGICSGTKRRRGGTQR
jgi:hypothetical protein